MYPHKMVGSNIPVCIIFEQEVHMFHSHIIKKNDAWIWLIDVKINCKLSWLSWLNTEFTSSMIDVKILDILTFMK